MRKLAIVCVFVALAACGGSGSSSSVVTMRGHVFDPDRTPVAAGVTVTWQNDTDEAHTVTAVEASLPDGADYFASSGAVSESAATDALSGGLIEPGASFEWTFEEPGTYRYYCIPHEGDGMVGTVIVE